MAFVKNSEERKPYEGKYNIDNPMDRAAVLEFERTYGQKNFTEVLIKAGLFRASLAYPEGAVVNKPEEVHDLAELYKALGKLTERREYMDKQEKHKIDQLAKANVAKKI